MYALYLGATGEPGEPGEKPLEQGEKQQQTQPHKSPGRNRSRARLVGGERSHHCSIPASHITITLFLTCSKLQL